MPIHDWTRVSPGTFHGFHTAWITELSRSLNNGILPDRFYAESEQIAGQTGPDVLTLEIDRELVELDKLDDSEFGGTALLTQSQPKVSVTQIASEAEIYSQRRHSLAIRHSSGDRLVAYIELISVGNKSNQRNLDRLLDKVCSVVEHGIHLVIVDPYPPGSLDANGIHGVIWNEIDPSSPFSFPDERRLTAVSYHALTPPVAYVELMSSGHRLPAMPLFLNENRYVYVPLEETYMAALTTIPKHHRKLLEHSEGS